MAVKKEVEIFINRYLRSQRYEVKIYPKTINKVEIKNLVDKLMKATDFERPDGYLYDNTTHILYIFEQFEFDCSPNNSSGSQLRENTSYVEKEIAKEISNTTSNTYHSTKVIDQGYSVKHGNTITYYPGEDGDKYRNNYISNFQEVYHKHSIKLKEYIQNCENVITEKPTKVITTFLIEDKTKLGTHYKNGCSVGDDVDLLTTKQFVDEFKDSNIDYVIFGALDNYFVSFCDRSILEIGNTDSIIDLCTKEFYILPAAILITSAKRNK